MYVIFLAFLPVLSGLGGLQRIKLDKFIILDSSIDMFWQVIFPSWFVWSKSLALSLVLFQKK